jgi:uncharacterized membrane protein YesL
MYVNLALFLRKDLLMGLFSKNYDKPGKGIDKNAPKKRRIWEFFEILWNQASKLVIANIIYSIAMLPLLVGLWLMFELNMDPNSPALISFTNNKIDVLGLGLIILSVFVSYPATTGFTYILRNIQRRQHAWMWHDFIKHTKANYMTGVKNGIVSLLVYFVLIFAFNAYSADVMNMGMVSVAFKYLMLLFVILFTWMQFYVNTMIVTFELKLREIYKNALIFAIAKLPVNLFVSIVCIAIFVLILLIPIPLIGFILTFFVWYSLFGFIVVFAVYPSIDKYMIQKAKVKEDDLDGEMGLL